MQLNTMTRSPPAFTHEGGPAAYLTAEQRLRRSVLSCLLWEREFYEDGQSIAARIAEAAEQVSVHTLAALTIEARERFHMRHVPLLLLTILAKRAAGTSLVGDTVERVIQRADELSELVSIYWRDGKRPLSAQMKKGLARAFRKFDAYALAKYDRAKAVRLRDVMFLTCPKPTTPEQAELWRKLAANELESPDTWEVALSSGADKRETFERLLREGQLGYLALLRNLRNMAQAGCDTGLVRDAILARKGARRVLPFRYVAAARAAPQFEPFIDQALNAAIGDMQPLPGRTAVLVDVSGSMDAPLSAKSDLKRIDAAAALASIILGDVRVFSFSHQVVEVPPRRGMAGVDVVIHSQPHGGTYLGAAVQAVNAQVSYDRLIVITDEQSADAVSAPLGRGYMINVASAQHGVGYGGWTRISGFSEAVLTFIAESEMT